MSLGWEGYPPRSVKAEYGAVIVLGLNAFGHDAAAVLLVDGKVVFAASEERFDRVRHSAGFPTGAIHAALTQAGLSPTDVDEIAFPWTRGMGRLQKAWHVVRGLPRSLAYFREAPDALLPDRRTYLRRMRGLETRIRAEGFTAPVRRVPHHLAHALSATLVLPGGRGAVFTADGMGEWTTAATWDATARPLQRLSRAVYPHSPGKAYAAVTAWLGWRPESDEGKTMGLAAYGGTSSAAYAFARNLLRPVPGRLLEIARHRFDFPAGKARLFGDAFLAQVGSARREADALRETDADMALGIQHAVESFGLAACRGVLDQTKAEAIGLAGGLFLNCAMNGRLLRELPARVHPFPVAGDAGAAWGAAAYVHTRRTGTPPEALHTLRLGTEINRAEVQRLAHDHGDARAHVSPDALADAVAARIARGEILGVARGRAEFGPRALGARSILASPTTVARRDDVNRRKGREAWRPLAPIVREADTRWFEHARPSPWMILTFRATPRACREIPGVVHADGTARVQTVTTPGDPFLAAVLDALERRGAPPVVINTSLNRRGEPIVDTASEALASATAIGLDAVLLDNVLLPLR